MPRTTNKADDHQADTTVADQWAVYVRADGSQYLVCVADAADVADDVTTAPESADDRRLAPMMTP